MCKRLGLCSKVYHKRYFKQLISRFGLHLQLESHNKSEVYRVWTTGNFYPKSSNVPPIEREAALRVGDTSKSPVAGSDIVENSSQPKKVLDAHVSEGNTKDNNKSVYDAAVMNEASKGCDTQNSGMEQSNEAGITEASKSTALDDEGSSVPLLQGNTPNSDVEEELLQGSKSVTNSNVVETHCLALMTPSKRRSNTWYPRPICPASSLREQHILKMLEVCCLIF